MAGAMELNAGADSQQGGLKILARAEYVRGPNILDAGRIFSVLVVGHIYLTNYVGGPWLPTL